MNVELELSALLKTKEKQTEIAFLYLYAEGQQIFSALLFGKRKYQHCGRLWFSVVLCVLACVPDTDPWLLLSHKAGYTVKQCIRKMFKIILCRKLIIHYENYSFIMGFLKTV